MYKLDHGEFRYLTSNTAVPSNTVQKLHFTNNRILDMVTGSTMATYWDDMGIVMDNTAGYTTFVPQRAGLFMLCVYLNWQPAQSTEYHVVEAIKDSNGAYLGVQLFANQQQRGTGTFILPLSVGEKVFLQVYHTGATKTYDTTSNVSFIQLL